MKQKRKFGEGLTPFMLDLQRVYVTGIVFGIGLGYVLSSVLSFGEYAWQFGLLVAGLGFYGGYKIANEVEAKWGA